MALPRRASAITRYAHHGDRPGRQFRQFPLGGFLRFLQGRRVLHVQPFGAVNDDVMNAGLHDLADFLFTAEQEAVAHEGVGHPVATEIVDKHAHFQLGRVDFLEHRKLCCGLCGVGKNVTRG
jgi:hypothetical protein